MVLEELEEQIQIMKEKVDEVKSSALALKEISNEMMERLGVLNAQIQFAVDYMNDHNLLDEGCFTFPDGETVYATQTLEGG